MYIYVQLFGFVQYIFQLHYGHVEQWLHRHIDWLQMCGKLIWIWMMLNLQKFCLTKFSCYTVVIKHWLRKHGCHIAQTYVLPNKILCCVSDWCDGMTFRITFWPFHKSFVSRKFGSIQDCMLEQWYRKYWEARPLHMYIVHVSLDEMGCTKVHCILCNTVLIA